MIETAEERMQKNALVEQLRKGVSKQQHHATLLRGKPRTDLPFMSLAELREALETRRFFSHEQAFKGLVVDEPYPPCTTPLADLQAVSIRDLFFESHHEGRVLIARRVGVVAVDAIGGTYGIEDQEGTPEVLIFDGFNYPGDDVIPTDAIVAIKHPYCKVDSRGQARIKVSHPTDLVVLKATDERVPLAWRFDGVVISDTTVDTAPRDHQQTEFLDMSRWTSGIEEDLSKAEVRPSTLGGHGLFARQDIKAGDLVIAERAVFTLSRADFWTYHAMKFDCSKNMMTEDELGAPYKEFARHLLSQPKLLDDVYRLYSGNIAAPADSAAVIDGSPVLDIFHINEIWSKNSIACPAPEPAVTRPFPFRNNEKAKPGCGLWICTAYINHSCIANTEKSIVGDLLILRAIRDIRQDEEITLTYYCEFNDQVEKRRALHRIWNFTCTCPLCVADRQIDPQVMQERELVTYQISGPLPAELRGKDAERAFELLKTVEKTYFVEGFQLYDGIPKIGVAKAYFRVAMIHTELGEYDKAEKMLIRALCELNIVLAEVDDGFELESGNWIIDEAIITSMLLLADMIEARRRSKASEDLLGIARKFYITLNGTMAGFELLKLPTLGFGGDSEDTGNV